MPSCLPLLHHIVLGLLLRLHHHDPGGAPVPWNMARAEALHFQMVGSSSEETNSISRASTLQAPLYGEEFEEDQEVFCPDELEVEIRTNSSTPVHTSTKLPSISSTKSKLPTSTASEPTPGRRHMIPQKISFEPVSNKRGTMARPTLALNNSNLALQGRPGLNVNTDSNIDLLDQLMKNFMRKPLQTTLSTSQNPTQTTILHHLQTTMAVPHHTQTTTAVPHLLQSTMATPPFLQSTLTIPHQSQSMPTIRYHPHYSGFRNTNAAIQLNSRVASTSSSQILTTRASQRFSYPPHNFNTNQWNPWHRVNVSTTDPSLRSSSTLILETSSLQPFHPHWSWDTRSFPSYSRTPATFPTIKPPHRYSLKRTRYPGLSAYNRSPTTAPRQSKYPVLHVFKRDPTTPIPPAFVRVNSFLPPFEATCNNFMCPKDKFTVGLSTSVKKTTESISVATYLASSTSTSTTEHTSSSVSTTSVHITQPCSTILPSPLVRFPQKFSDLNREELAFLLWFWKSSGNPEGPISSLRRWNAETNETIQATYNALMPTRSWNHHDGLKSRRNPSVNAHKYPYLSHRAGNGGRLKVPRSRHGPIFEATPTYPGKSGEMSTCRPCLCEKSTHSSSGSTFNVPSFQTPMPQTERFPIPMIYAESFYSPQEEVYIPTKEQLYNFATFGESLETHHLSMDKFSVPPKKYIHSSEQYRSPWISQDPHFLDSISSKGFYSSEDPYGQHYTSTSTTPHKFYIGLLPKKSLLSKRFSEELTHKYEHKNYPAEYTSFISQPAAGQFDTKSGLISTRPKTGTEGQSEQHSLKKPLKFLNRELSWMSHLTDRHPMQLPREIKRNRYLEYLDFPKEDFGYEEYTKQAANESHHMSESEDFSEYYSDQWDNPALSVGPLTIDKDVLEWISKLRNDSQTTGSDFIRVSKDLQTETHAEEQNQSTTTSNVVTVLTEGLVIDSSNGTNGTSSKSKPKPKQYVEFVQPCTVTVCRPFQSQQRHVDDYRTRNHALSVPNVIHDIRHRVVPFRNAQSELLEPTSLDSGKSRPFQSEKVVENERYYLEEYRRLPLVKAEKDHTQIYRRPPVVVEEKDYPEEYWRIPSVVEEKDYVQSYRRLPSGIPEDYPQEYRRPPLAVEDDPILSASLALVEPDWWEKYRSYDVSDPLKEVTWMPPAHRKIILPLTTPRFSLSSIQLKSPLYQILPVSSSAELNSKFDLKPYETASTTTGYYSLFSTTSSPVKEKDQDSTSIPFEKYSHRMTTADHPNWTLGVRDHDVFQSSQTHKPIQMYQENLPTKPDNWHHFGSQDDWEDWGHTTVPNYATSMKHVEDAYLPSRNPSHDQGLSVTASYSTIELRNSDSPVHEGAVRLSTFRTRTTVPTLPIRIPAYQSFQKTPACHIPTSSLALDNPVGVSAYGYLPGGSSHDVTENEGSPGRPIYRDVSEITHYDDLVRVTPYEHTRSSTYESSVRLPPCQDPVQESSIPKLSEASEYVQRISTHDKLTGESPTHNKYGVSQPPSNQTPLDDSFRTRRPQDETTQKQKLTEFDKVSLGNYQGKERKPYVRLPLMPFQSTNGDHFREGISPKSQAGQGNANFNSYDKVSEVVPENSPYDRTTRLPSTPQEVQGENPFGYKSADEYFENIASKLHDKMVQQMQQNYKKESSEVSEVLRQLTMLPLKNRNLHKQDAFENMEWLISDESFDESPRILQDIPIIRQTTSIPHRFEEYTNRRAYSRFKNIWIEFGSKLLENLKIALSNFTTYKKNLPTILNSKVSPHVPTANAGYNASSFGASHAPTDPWVSQSLLQAKSRFSKQHEEDTVGKGKHTNVRYNNPFNRNSSKFLSPKLQEFLLQLFHNISESSPLPLNISFPDQVQNDKNTSLLESIASSIIHKLNLDQVDLAFPTKPQSKRELLVSATPNVTKSSKGTEATTTCSSFTNTTRTLEGINIQTSKTLTSLPAALGRIAPWDMGIRSDFYEITGNVSPRLTFTTSPNTLRDIRESLKRPVTIDPLQMKTLHKMQVRLGSLLEEIKLSAQPQSQKHGARIVLEDGLAPVHPNTSNDSQPMSSKYDASPAIRVNIKNLEHISDLILKRVLGSS